MRDKLKWLGVVATVCSAVIILLSAVFSIAYQQALVNLLVGEFVVIAAAHSTYRVSSGKQAAPLGAVITILGGAVLAGTPYLLYRVDPFLTIQLVCSLVVILAGLSVVVERFIGGEEGRQTGAQRIASGSTN